MTKKPFLIWNQTYLNVIILVTISFSINQYYAYIGVLPVDSFSTFNAGYDILNLITYFTCGPKETRAWTITTNTTAPKAAGKIHSDFQKGFIRAETISYDDFVKFKGEVLCREAGKLRQEGKDYIVQDGDVMHFLFNN